MGDANDVPQTDTYPPPWFVVYILSPGALISTVSPAVAQHPKLSLGPVAVTDITFDKPDKELELEMSN